jgi:hypothetical protein
MTKIILFVIALQVVFGILAKRKARKQAQEAARNPNGAAGGGSGATASLPSAARTPSAWGGGHSEDESEEEWDEHHSDEGAEGEEDARSRPDTRAQHRRLPDEHPAPRRMDPRGEGREGRDEDRNRDEHPVRKGIDKAKAAELGKDLLSQLAKELGLEIPTGPKPAPRPIPAAARPQTAAQAPAAAAKVKASATMAAKQSAATAKMALGRESGRTRLDAGEDTPRRAQGYLAVTPAVPMAARVSATARASLMDIKSLRNAFILKTILDKPVSINPRVPGED